LEGYLEEYLKYRFLIKDLISIYFLTVWTAREIFISEILVGFYI